MTAPDKSALDRMYAAHPFQQRTILARLARQRVPLAGLREQTLASDVDTDVTDQNHVGGAEFVGALAQAAHIHEGDLVLDIGSGLGGSARLLAETIGCRVWAIEQDERRHQEARALTSLVGLDALVTLVRGDATIDPSPIARADVLWGQSAWVHFTDKAAFLAKWAPVLAPGGRIAIEDAYLRRPVDGQDEHALIEDLERSWSASLVPLEDWHAAVEASRGSIALSEDLTAECAAYFARLRQVSERWPAGDLSVDERSGWQRAARAIAAGLLGYFRIVARTPSGDGDA